MRHNFLILAVAAVATAFLAVPAGARMHHANRATQDSTFVKQAAEGNLAEVQIAELAKSKASSQSVKDLANKLETDHTQSNDKLKLIASKQNVTWPSGMDSKARAEYNKLQGLSGTAFDREFVNFQIKDHKQDIAMFQREANRGANADVKAFASETLPTLQEHLRLSEDARNSIGSAGK